MVAILRSVGYGLVVGFVLCQVANAQQEKVLDFLKVGDTAPDVELQLPGSSEKVKLSTLAEKGPVVLAVLRGYPGYQCPACSRQLGDLVQHADDFAIRRRPSFWFTPVRRLNCLSELKSFCRARRCPSRSY